MYELIAELIFLRNQQPADTQGIPPIWQKLVRSEGRPSRAAVQQALIYLVYKPQTRESQGFPGFLVCRQPLPVIAVFCHTQTRK